MIDWFAGLPGWLLTHPWALAGGCVAMMGLGVIGVIGVLVNRADRQIREILRRKP